ncbi:MAG: iron-containing alcohol dehydrogenase, partial [Halanaerobium sp.]
SFTFANTPKIIFENGSFKKLPELIAAYGEKTLIVTGGSSLYKSGRFDELSQKLKEYSISFSTVKVTDEPSPNLIDKIVDKYRGKGISSVTAIGGGSVMDTGKAISAMLTQEDSVLNYLEVVGSGKEHPGDKIPFIAVPTTSGTGSEATKNAVLSKVGEDGFKKSLRHDNFIPNIALLDPKLTISCPADITAASGLDAVTQLLGAYTSTKASPITDSLALKALKYAGESLVPAAVDKGDDPEVRAGMAYASLISGITLANAGLGIVHGLASAVGGYFDIPHGIVCGTLLAEAVKLNIRLLRENNNIFYLKKYAKAGAVLSGENNLDINSPQSINRYCDLLIDILAEWTAKLNISRLGEYGVSEDDLDKIAAKAGNKNNPVQLDKEQIKKLIRSRL